MDLIPYLQSLAQALSALYDAIAIDAKPWRSALCPLLTIALAAFAWHQIRGVPTR